ncbi:unnamed protein product, partial [marine sediment metagenome]
MFLFYAYVDVSGLSKYIVIVSYISNELSKLNTHHLKEQER